MNFLDFILPPRCGSCGTETLQPLGLCSFCWEKLHFIGEPQCERCGYPFEIAEISGILCGACMQKLASYDRLRAVLRYDDVSKLLLMRFKHGDATHLAPLFVRWMAQAGQTLITESDVLLPVPLHWRRLLKRGYNQAALLAQGLSRQYRKVYLPHLLKRKRYTPSQGTKTVLQRLENVAGAFHIPSFKRNFIEGKKVLLIDDVYTSGATINECVKVLNHARVKGVNVLTLARVVRPEIIR